MLGTDFRPGRLATLALLSLLLFPAKGCGEDEAEELEENETLYFEPLAFGIRGSLTDTVEAAVRDAELWASYQDSLRPTAPFDSVDFSQTIVLLAALPHETSGYAVDFLSVELRDSVVVAEYSVSIPGDDCLTATARTVAFQAVIVRRTDAPVRFIRSTEEYRCTAGRRR